MRKEGRRHLRDSELERHRVLLVRDRSLEGVVLEGDVLGLGDLVQGGAVRLLLLQQAADQAPLGRPRPAARGQQEAHQPQHRHLRAGGEGGGR